VAQREKSKTKSIKDFGGGGETLIPREASKDRRSASQSLCSQKREGREVTEGKGICNLEKGKRRGGLGKDAVHIEELFFNMISTKGGGREGVVYQHRHGRKGNGREIHISGGEGINLLRERNR